MVAHGAWVVVITDFGVVGIHATGDVAALVVGAWVSVIAVDDLTDGAGTVFARFDRAKATVVAGTIDGGIRAACIPAACVFRAWITIVAIQGDFPGADALFAYVANGAGIAVVTQSFDRFIDAATGSVATVHRADVIVPAIDRLPDAFTGLAVVGHGA